MVTAFGPRSRLARGLSLLVAALTAVASGSGLLVDGLYRDPPEVAAMLRGYDLVNLAAAVPVLGLSLLPGWRASLRALLIRVGTLLYLSYTYATHVFGSVFNDLFLLHVAVFGVSLYAVGFCVASLPVARLTDRPRRRTPIKVVSVILAVLGLTLGGMWIFYSLRFAFTGQEPQESRLVLPLAGRRLGYVEDLAFLVPASTRSTRSSPPWLCSAPASCSIASRCVTTLVEPVRSWPNSSQFRGTCRIRRLRYDDFPETAAWV